jgi:hypothetical protein
MWNACILSGAETPAHETNHERSSKRRLHRKEGFGPSKQWSAPLLRWGENEARGSSHRGKTSFLTFKYNPIPCHIDDDDDKNGEQNNKIIKILKMGVKNKGYFF